MGAGYTGLGAARRLLQAGADVTVYERSGHPGGLAMTLPVAGTEVEKYYHHWFTSDDEIRSLVRELGLEDRLLWLSPVMGMFHRGRLYRFMSPGDLLRFRPLGWHAKIRFGLVTLFLQHCPRQEWFEDVTAADWLRRAAGREAYEALWEPLLRAKFGRNAARVSMAWIWSKMRTRGRSREKGGMRESLGYMRGGFGVLTRALVEDVRRRGGAVHLAERVTRASRDGSDGSCWIVETTRRRDRFDAVLLTVAPPLVPGLVPELPGSYRRHCESIEYAAILCSLAVLRRPFSRMYWINVADRRIPFGGVMEHTNFVPPEQYAGKRLLYVSHYQYPDEPTYRMSGAELFETYRPGLERIGEAFDASQVEQWQVFRDRYAQPIVTADYHRRLLPFETPAEGLYLASMAQVYPQDRGTNYAARLGRQAAERIIERETRVVTT